MENSHHTVKSIKNRWVALVLCMLLGFFGVHRFYVGKAGSGLAYALTGGGLLFGVIIDFMMILSGSFTDKAGYFLV